MAKSKRICAFLLAVMILTSSIATVQYETVKSAEWIAGAVASVGGAPLLTALLVGGVVVAGGIAIYEIAQTDAEDYRNFYNGIKTGFQEFVAEQETIIAKEQDSSLTDQQASDIGVAVARDTVNDFMSNTVDNVKTTTRSVKDKALAYWDLYSTIINGVADNGLSNSSPLLPETEIKQYARNYTTANFNDIYQLDNVGANCKQVYNATNPTQFDHLNKYWFIQKGSYAYYSNGNYINYEINNLGSSSSTQVPYVAIDWQQRAYGNSYVWDFHSQINNYNFITGKSTYNKWSARKSGIQTYQELITIITAVIHGTNIPIVIGNTESAIHTQVESTPLILSVHDDGSSANIKSYQRTIQNTLDNTHIGKSIQTGRRQLVNSGDYVGSIFVEDSIPVKKQGLKVAEGVATGSIGWDIPANDVWDDYLAGNLPFPDVVGDTGTIVVPRPNVTDFPTDSTVSIPSDTVVTDSYPKAEDDPDNPNNETTPDEVNQDQAGSYYPSALDLTNIFPFCIPFDIIYIVQQYSGVQANAPVIHWVIPYPNALKGSLGESYEITIDFNDYVAVRNVLRIFILLLFIAGLMKITRDLIRG